MKGGREGGRAGMLTSMTIKMLSSEGSLMTSKSKTTFRWYRCRMILISFSICGGRREGGREGGRER
jgi:hypothetical protein